MTGGCRRAWRYESLLDRAASGVHSASRNKHQAKKMISDLEQLRKPDFHALKMLK